MTAELVVLAFEGEQAAYYVLKDLEAIAEDGGFTIVEAVTAARTMPDAGSAVFDQELAEAHWRTAASAHGSDLTISYAHRKTGKYVLGGSGAGLLAGLLLGGPIGGLVVGATAGGIAGALQKRGIEKGFVYDVAESLPPGRSALFLLVDEMTPEAQERAMQRLRGREPLVLKTSLSAEQEAALRADLAGSSDA